MAKLHFKYGTMNSSKTANLLMTAHNYEENGRVVWLFQSIKNTRDNSSKIMSRVGIEKPCFTFTPTANLVLLVNNLSEILDEFPDVILIDEIQFAEPEQIKQLVTLVDDFDITVITYGLKTDYKAQLFDSVKELLIYSDKVEEIKQICSMCDKKAFMNLKIKDDIPVYDGDTLSIGDVKNSGKEQEDEFYVPVCRKHYFRPDMKELNIF